jgi:hypothetical protein
LEERIGSRNGGIEVAQRRLGDRAEEGGGHRLLTCKTLYYELTEAVDGGRHAEKMFSAFGPSPDDLPDHAA